MKHYKSNGAKILTDVLLRGREGEGNKSKGSVPYPTKTGNAMNRGGTVIINSPQTLRNQYPSVARMEGRIDLLYCSRGLGYSLGMWPTQCFS